jgi:peptidoglycan hydrolase-like protein with peptidoglycan-binding domain
MTFFVTGSKKTGNPYPEPSKNIRLNSKGNDVRWLQYELNQHGHRLIVDGDAGNATIEALIKFQKKSIS